MAPPLQRSTLVRAAAAAAAGLAVGASSDAAVARAPRRDTRILNWLLMLELVQEALYTRAARTPAIRGELRTFAREAAEHERRHVRRLTEALGDAARRPPRTRLDEAVRSEGAFTAAALSLEETSTASFIGQAANLSTSGIELVAPIVSVDARHAAWIRAIAGRIPAPRAADPPKTPEQALRVLDRMGVVDGT